MLRMFKHLLLGLCIFTLVFTFFPTGSTGHVVVEGYRGTLSYGGSQAAMTSAYLGSLQGDTAQEAAKDYANNTLRGQIVQFAVDTAITYGNGYILPGESASNHPYATRDGKVIHYCTLGHDCESPGCDDPVYSFGSSKYWSWNVGGVERLLQEGHLHLHCHWAASYCWAHFLEPAQLSGGGADFVHKYPKTYSVSSLDELLEKVKPGDMVHLANDGNTQKLSADHSFLWIGDWTSPDGTECTNMKMNCGGGMSYNDFIIKQFSSTEWHSGCCYWITPLDEMCSYWTEKGMFGYTDYVADGTTIAAPNGATGG